MNDDDYWNVISGSTSATRELYDLLKNYKNYKDYNDYCRKDIDMAYSYSRGYYQDTNSKEVATAVLDAYANGVPFETLIKKNKTVRQYWYQIQSEKVKAEQSREREKIRLAKLAEKRAEEKAKREEVMSKLSREELEAFGFVKKGKR
jgi:hypothetical protein